MTLICEYTVLIGDPIAVQMLTHNPSLSSVSRYPVTFEFPRAEARHHRPDLPRAPTPRAFEGINSLLRRHATSPLPPTPGSSRDGHPRHGSEVGSWEHTSPCCSGQSQQVHVRLSTTQQDRGECGQETSQIAVNIRDAPVSV